MASAPSPVPAPAEAVALTPQAADFYRRSMEILQAAGVPFLVGGTYALTFYTGIQRPTKDIDLFLRREDLGRALQAFEAAGYRTDRAFPHWLAKAYDGEHFIDLIYGAGNGVSEVDDQWFEHAAEALVLDLKVGLCPVEETIWSKAFIMERERFDGADVAHLIHSHAHRMDWGRLLQRFGPHWRILLIHLTLYGFVYPADRDRVPQGVLHELTDRLRTETDTPPPADAPCQGTLLSRAQYLVDIEGEYRDARLWPEGPLTAYEIARWTSDIDPGEKTP